MSKDELVNYICEALPDEEVTLADGLEDAFLGIGRHFGKPIAVYSRRKCIEVFMRDMSEDEAEEYFEFNVAEAWVGETTPVFLEEMRNG